MSKKNPGHLQKVTGKEKVARVLRTTSPRSNHRGAAIDQVVENVGPYPEGWAETVKKRGT